MEDRKRRLDIILEPLMVVVADDDQHVGIDLHQALAQDVELMLAAGIPFLANIERVLVLEMLILAKLVELLEVVSPRLERQSLVLAINIRAQVPFMRRRRQKGPVRGAKP